MHFLVKVGDLLSGLSSRGLLTLLFGRTEFLDSPLPLTCDENCIDIHIKGLYKPTI